MAAQFRTAGVVVAVLLAGALGATGGFTAGAIASIEGPTTGSDRGATQDRGLESPDLPGGASIEVQRVAGKGPSEAFSFDPNGRLYTVSVACSSAARGQSLTVRDPSWNAIRSVRVPCDGVVSQVTIRSAADRARQVAVDAPRSIRWKLVVYTGTPDGVEITA